MRAQARYVALALACTAGALVAAAAMASPGVTEQRATLGSTSGTPTANLCDAGAPCTYLPLTAGSTPTLQVPFDGTVTSFSVNSGICGAKVQLRVLRPAGNGQYVAVRTGPLEILSLGLSDFPVMVPVQKGDVLALDNASGALIFDTSSAAESTAYFKPALTDGSTGAPTGTAGDGLLLSAVVDSGSAPAPSVTPSVAAARQSHAVWREPGRPARAGSGRHRSHPAPVGTTFSFKLNEPAGVRLAFTQRLGGRRVSRGAVEVSGRQGANTVRFAGRPGAGHRLRPGRYTLTITATSAGGARSRPAVLNFRIVR